MSTFLFFIINNHKVIHEGDGKYMYYIFKIWEIKECVLKLFFVFSYFFFFSPIPSVRVRYIVN